MLVGLLASCSYNDLTDLWPSGNDVEEEIVIREIPGESFDPEDTEEITASPHVFAAPTEITSPAAALVKVLLVPVILLFAKSTAIVPVAYTASAVPQSAIRFTLLKNCRA